MKKICTGAFLVLFWLPIPVWPRLLRGVRLQKQSALSRNSTKQLAINSSAVHVAGNNTGYSGDSGGRQAPAWGAPTAAPTWGAPTAAPAWGTPTAAPAWGAAAPPPPPVVVYDTWGWTNGHSSTCADYARNGWCAGGTFVKGSEWTGAKYFHHPSCTWGADCSQFYNDPSSNCVVCGKKAEVVDTLYWTNGHGSTCADYATNWYCHGGDFMPDNRWTGAKGVQHESCTWGEDCAQFYNAPADNCVACGKKVEVMDTPGWTSGHGHTCADYATNWYCHGGAFMPDFEWTGKRHAHHESCTWGEDCKQFYNDPAANCVVCGKRAEVVDTPGWTNGRGQTCADYATNWYCHGGAFMPENTWAGARGTLHPSCTWGEDCAQFNNYPADNCVVCGKTTCPGS